MRVKKGYLKTGKKEECFGCESCVQICPKHSVELIVDDEGFRYPRINPETCIDCGLCNSVCPQEIALDRFSEEKYAFGGYILDSAERENSTSGGAFTAIVNTWCDNDYVIFGVESDGLNAKHSYITDKTLIHRFQKSKYTQSVVGESYKEVRKFLLDGKKVLFSGTPCQIAGLKAFLKNITQENLLTVEVVCEGVPSPLYMEKFDQHCSQKFGGNIENLNYRDKDKCKWDFQVMSFSVKGKNRKLDRWFNPFWSIWLNHLMSRPSCYECPFASKSRIADITLGDLWGVHLYCPELYGKNGGSSLMVGNTDKGKTAIKEAEKLMFGHELEFETALKYQGPMRKSIPYNPEREVFMNDLKSNQTYTQLNKKWTKGPTLKLLIQKYIWGNRQKVALWNLLNSKGNE